MPIHQTLSASFPKIKLIILDVDGVLTDGRFGLLASGEEIKFFSIYDGIAIRLAQQAGIEVAFLSARQSAAVAQRAGELGVKVVIQGSTDKMGDFKRLLEKKGLQPGEVAYMGDDLPDLPLLRTAGFSAAPSNAAEQVKYCVHYVTRAGGGAGAVREVINLLLKTMGKWEELTESESRVPAAG